MKMLIGESEGKLGKREEKENDRKMFIEESEGKLGYDLEERKK